MLWLQVGGNMAIPVTNNVPFFLICCDTGEGKMVIIGECVDVEDCIKLSEEAKQTVTDVYVYRLMALAK
jgi:hypothetical protein